MADSPTDIDGVFAFKRQNVAKERFYSVVHLPPPFAPAGAPARRRPFCHYFTDRLQRVGVNTVFPLCFPERSRGTAEIDAAFASFAQEPPDALFVAADAFFNSRRAQFATLTARERIASAFSDRAMVAAGGLMSYGADLAEIAHQVGLYTGNILEGAKPADLPVQQSTKFNFAINLQTARVLGIEVPSGVLSIADKVIE